MMKPKSPCIRVLLPAFCVLAALGGCSGFFGDDEDPPLEGHRISVLELQKSLEPDDVELEAEGLMAPSPWRNEFWPQAGGYPNHSMQNISLSPGRLDLVWTADIGQGRTGKLPLNAQPVVVDGRIYTLDTEAVVSAFAVEDGKELWRTNVADKEEDDPVIGGGLAYAGGHLYVTSGYDEILALDPETGKIRWRKTIPAPSRAAPTVMDGRIFITTLDNRLLALSAEDGASLWDYVGLSETAGLLGAASPAANSDLVIPVFSSGEITALRVANGSVAWSDNLSNLQRIGGLAGLADIRGLPVIDKGMVIAISFSGRLVAIDERSGARAWQREIGGSETPWLAGNHMFVLSSDNQLVALGRDNGVIRWVTDLPRFKDGDKDEPVSWSGPVLAGGRLILAGSEGSVIEVGPEGGRIKNQWKTGKAVSIAPVVAGDTLYLLADDGTLMAYR